MIFEYLDRVSSTCLCLTSRALYPVHKKLHGIVRLKTPYIEKQEERFPTQLGELLQTWAGPDFGYFRSAPRNVFFKVPKNVLSALEVISASPIVDIKTCVYEGSRRQEKFPDRKVLDRKPFSWFWVK